MTPVSLGTCVAVVAGMTVREMVRKRLFAAGALLTLAFLALYALGLREVREDLLAAVEGRGGRWGVALGLGLMVEAVGLYLATLLTALLTALSCAGAVQGDVESGVLQALAARPVSRAGILLGKVLGALLVFVPYAAVLYAAVVLLARAMVHVPVQGFGAGLLTFVLIPPAMVAVTFALGSRLGPLATAAAATLLLGSAMVGGMLEQVGVLADVEGLRRIGILTGLVLPTDTLYRRVAALTLGGRVGGGPLELLTAAAGPFGAASVPSGWAVAYGAAYAVALLGLAARRFATRDL